MDDHGHLWMTTATYGWPLLSKVSCLCKPVDCMQFAQALGFGEGFDGTGD